MWSVDCITGVATKYVSGYSQQLPCRSSRTPKKGQTAVNMAELVADERRPQIPTFAIVEMV